MKKYKLTMRYMCVVGTTCITVRQTCTTVRQRGGMIDVGMLS